MEARMERIILDADGKPWFAVEVDGVESPLRGGMHTTIENAASGLEDVGKVIAKSCTDIMTTLRTELGAAAPEEVELSFGVTLSGEASIPLVSKASGEATFGVRILWKPEAGK